MSHRAASSSSTVELTIDGQAIKVPAGTTVFDAARMNGIEIPVLCHQQNETPVGVCRMCVVDVGARAYAAACIRHVDPGMAVKTQTKEVLAARKTLLELMMADHPTPCVRQQHTGDCELEQLATQYGASASRYPRREVTRGQDDSSLTILVDHSACILCDRCVRACADLRHNFVIARQGKGYDAGISFDLDDPMGSSTCVSCGECMVSCPTGALTNKVAAGQKLESGLSLETEELLKLPVFQGVSGTFLEVNRGSVTMRKIKKGELLFREGDYGSTAFYILEGQIDIFISSPRAHVNTQKGPSRLFNILQNKLVGRREQPRPDENFARTYISIDAPVELSYDHPVAQLGPGDLFGEMTCMSFYPRSATARAATDCVVLEMLRNVLDVLQKNKTFRARLESDYRQRALETHLRSVPILSVLTHEFIDELRDKVELVRYAPGEVIFHQGDLEVVRISTADFTEMLRQFPEVRGRLEAISVERLRENQARFKQVSQVPVDEFLRQGLMEAQNLLVLDLDRCTRCDQCVKACADAHGGVTRLIRDGLRLDRFLIATSCRHCRDPLCMVGCPVGAIRRQNSLEVIIEDWCIGCGVCANNCPYGNINLQNFSVDGPVSDEIAQLAAGQERAKKARVVRKATSCNLCNDYPEPSCVYACPHDAAHRVEPVEFFGRMIKE